MLLLMASKGIEMKAGPFNLIVYPDMVSEKLREDIQVCCAHGLIDLQPEARAALVAAHILDSDANQAAMVGATGGPTFGVRSA